MKNSIIVLIILLSTQLTKAQLAHRSSAVGVDFFARSISGSNEITRSNSTVGQTDSKTFEISVLPFWDKFVADKFSIGFGPGIVYSKTEFTQSSRTTILESRSYAAVLRLRKFYDISEKWFFLLDGQIAYSDNERKEETTSVPANAGDSRIITKGYGLGAEIRPGVLYFINSKFGMEVKFGVLQFVHTEEDVNNSGSTVRQDVKSDTFSAEFNFSTLNFGVQYYF